jgi:hypothetical protein
MLIGRRPALVPRDYLVRAKAATIRLAAVQLLALHAARRAWEQRMGELLLGAPRTGRACTAKDPDPGKAFPGGEIYLSFPGLGDRLAAWVAGEIGDHIEQFTAPNGLQMLRRPSPGHPALRQERFRRRLPAGAQPISRRRRPSVGILQPAAERLGPGIL